MGHPLRLSCPCVPEHPADRVIFPFHCHAPAGTPACTPRPLRIQRSPKTPSQRQRLRRKPPFLHGSKRVDPCSLRSSLSLHRDPQHQGRPRSSSRRRLRFCPMQSLCVLVDPFVVPSDHTHSLRRALLSLSLPSTLNLPRHSLVVPFATKRLGPCEPFSYHTGLWASHPASVLFTPHSAPTVFTPPDPSSGDATGTGSLEPIDPATAMRLYKTQGAR